LLGRTLPAEIRADLVSVETLATLLERVQLQLAGRPTAVVSTHERLRRRILREGFDGANVLYVLNNDDVEVIRAAKAAGLAILYEQITPPCIGRVLRIERDLFPGIEKQDSEREVEEGIARDIEVFKLADTVICASEQVRRDVLSLAGPSSRTALIPYGINADWLSVNRQPIEGRVLFVGNVGLGKGSHYLAEATRLLQARGVRCEVRVVGPYASDVISHPAFRGPNYVGQVPRELIRNEFARADVFALPTLADGMAIAHVEALACGVPVVTTPNCGSQVRDGEDGFIVPTRDVPALADRLEQIIRDRGLRQRLSAAAAERAMELSWTRFGERLLAETTDVLRAFEPQGRVAC
jgi:glycosyltransferase involved in cell wall biosynthesis